MRTNHYFWRLLFHGSKFLLRVSVILTLWVRDSLKEFIAVFKPLLRSVESQAREAAAAGSLRASARPKNAFKIGAFLLGTLAVMGKIFLFILSTAPDFEERKEDSIPDGCIDSFGTPDITNTAHTDWPLYYGPRK